MKRTTYLANLIWIAVLAMSIIVSTVFAAEEHLVSETKQGYDFIRGLGINYNIEDNHQLAVRLLSEMGIRTFRIEIGWDNVNRGETRLKNENELRRIFTLCLKYDIRPTILLNVHYNALSVGTPEFEEMVKEWIRRVDLVLDLLQDLRIYEFDIEIWNELNFESPSKVRFEKDFLRPGGYAWEIARRTARRVKERFPKALCIWGFSNTTFPYTPIEELPPGIDGRSYHLYGTGTRSSPEQTESLIHLLNSEARRRGPKDMDQFHHYITEYSVVPGKRGIKEEDEAWELKAKVLLCAFTFWLNKGIDVMHYYCAYSKDPMEAGLLPPDLPSLPVDADFDDVATPPMRVMRNLKDLFKYSEPVISIADLDVDLVALGGNHPPLRHREAFSFLPFQISPGKLAIAVYVMTYDITKKMSEERYRLTIRGKGSFPREKAYLYDPIWDGRKRVEIEDREIKDNEYTVTVEIPVVDYPRFLVFESSYRVNQVRFERGTLPVLWHVKFGTLGMVSPPRYDELTPDFCLYGDGTLIYRASPYPQYPHFKGEWRRVRLDEKEMNSILDRLIESDILSFDLADVHPWRSKGVTDCITTVIGFRLRDGSRTTCEREISIYDLEGKVQDYPEATSLRRVLELSDFLSRYEHPNSESYNPETVELIVMKVPGVKPRRRSIWEKMFRRSRGERHLQEWKVRGIDLDRTERRGVIGVIELQGEEIKRVSKILNRDGTPEIFLYKGTLYWVWMRPVLPGYPSWKTYIPRPGMGIIVTDLEGEKIPFSKAVWRYFGKLISIIFPLGFIMAGFTEKKQAFHDIITGCLVIDRRSSSLPPPRRPYPEGPSAQPPLSRRGIRPISRRRRTDRPCCG